MQLLPEEEKIFWNQWQLRLTVIFSLALQIILTVFGSRRKFMAKSLIHIVVWSAYLSADWVATVALGNLARSENIYSKSNAELQAFWASFLLIHLGGPDTISAFSLEDNELWLRHLLSLFVQGVVAFYVYVRFWSTSLLTYTATPIFVVGALKYGERVFVLYSSSKEKMKKFSLSDLFPGKNRQEIWDWEARSLVHVCCLLESCALLCTGQALDFLDERFSRTILIGKSAEQQGETTDAWPVLGRSYAKKSAAEIFKIIEIELGFMYDLLYTKAKMIYSRFGISARCFSLLYSVTALVIFSIFIHSPVHPLADIIITYLLLIGAIFTDLYGFILHLFSDWTKLYLSKYRERSQPDISFDATFFSHPLLSNQKRWSRSMGQLNLISYCIKDEVTAASAAVGKLLAAIQESLENQWYVTWVDVSDELERLILRELKSKIEMVRTARDEPFCLNAEGQRVMAGKGNYVLKQRYGFESDDDDHMPWFAAGKPYDYNLLAWHIATDLCYRDDLDSRFNGNADRFPPSGKISKCLSDYMLYLLVVCPSLMPEECLLGERYKRTCDNVISYYKLREKKGCQRLLKMPITLYERSQQSKYDAYATKSGRLLGKRLQVQESMRDWNNGRKWEMISEVWVEMLAYAASHSAWNAHVQHLRKGGELLTHVRLLMAHLGLSSQYLYGLKFYNEFPQPVY